MSVKRTKTDSILELQYKKQQQELLEQVLQKMAKDMEHTENDSKNNDSTDKQP